MDQLPEYTVYTDNDIEIRGGWIDLPNYKSFVTGGTDKLLLNLRRKLLILNDECNSIDKNDLDTTVNNLKDLEAFLKFYFWFLLPGTVILAFLILCFLVTISKSIRGKNYVLLFLTIFVCLYLAVVAIF